MSLTNRCAKLVAWSIALALVWLVLLPWIGNLPAMSSHIDHMNEKNINVGAMYYSELNWQPPDGVAFR